LDTVADWSKKHSFTFETQFVEPTHVYILNFEDGQKLKIDFAYYPHKMLDKRKRLGKLEVDSKLDIAENKTLLISGQRVEVKDFVDLYFLLQEFTVWDLIEDVRIKFNARIEPFVLASDFTTPEEFEFLPKMLKPCLLKN